MNRYRSDSRIRAGLSLGTNQSVNKIRMALRHGRLRTSSYVIKESERLDTLAARFLGDSGLWWVLATCSNIGWNLQVPPGTQILIPENLEIISTMV